MSENELLETLAKFFTTGRIKVITQVIKESARYGSGQWNTAVTIIMIDGVQVARVEGEVDLCDPV